MVMRGVNLGGWLVLEKWMTPTLFKGADAVDEYTFMQTKGAREKLRDHQKNFIREADFKWLHDNGVQAVRIPVGYWILEGDKPYVSAIGRLDWAFAMAEKYDIEVLICLHGAVGSQNGHDHSGKVGRAEWYANAQYRNQTITTLEALASRYRDSAKFWGIELLNEPKPGLFQLKLRAFYRNAYQALARILRPSTRIVFHDAFTPRLMNAAITGSARTMMDIHWYHFTFLLHRWAPLWLYWWLITWHGNLVANLRHWQCIAIGVVLLF
jgi:glucan 1,3-beta-glucosidase